MPVFFAKLLEMSMVGGIAVLAVLILRLPMRKLPRKYSYVLWLIPAVRLLIPFALSAPVSVFNYIPIPQSEVYVTEQYLGVDSNEIGTTNVTGELPSDKATEGKYPANTSGYISGISDNVTDPPVSVTQAQRETVGTDIPSVVTPEVSEKTDVSDVFHLAINAGAVIWCIGFAVMACYVLYSFNQTAEKVENAVHLRDNVYTSNNINTPFVFGFVSPRVYVPANTAETDLVYVLAHENAHIKRGDHFIKAVAAVILAVHWFNPLVWIAFRFMTEDMELSCDEKALNTYDLETRKEYARALLNMCESRDRLGFGSILSFGESRIKNRIKGVLRTKKPKIIMCVAASAAILLAAVCLLTSAVEDKGKEPSGEVVAGVVTDGTDEPDLSQDSDTSPDISDMQSLVTHSFAVCADGRYYLVKTVYDEKGRISYEEYTHVYAEADCGYHSYKYDEQGRLSEWIMGGTVTGVSVEVTFGYSNSGEVYSSVRDHMGRNTTYPGYVEYHDNGIIKLLRLGSESDPFLYRKYDSIGRRTEEYGNSPVAADAYFYEWTLSSVFKFKEGGFFILDYAEDIEPKYGAYYFESAVDSAEMVPHYFIPDYSGGRIVRLRMSGEKDYVNDNSAITDVVELGYNANGKLEKAVWPGLMTVISSFDGNGRISAVEYTGPENADKTPVFGVSLKYEYHDNGLLASKLQEKYRLGNNGYYLKQYNDLTFNLSGDMLTESYYRYLEGLTLEEEGREIQREYYENGAIKKEVKTAYSKGTYLNSVETVSEYTTLGNIDSAVETRKYNGEVINVFEHVYYYGPGGNEVLTHIIMCYEDGAPKYKQTLSYYSSGVLLEDRYEYYNDSGEIVSDSYRYYDEDNNILTEKYYEFDKLVFKRYSYLNGVQSLVTTLEQAIDHHLRAASRYSSQSGKGGVSPKLFSDLVINVEHEYCDEVAEYYVSSVADGTVSAEDVKAVYLEFNVAKDAQKIFVVAIKDKNDVWSIVYEMPYATAVREWQVN